MLKSNSFDIVNLFTDLEYPHNLLIYLILYSGRVFKLHTHFIYPFPTIILERSNYTVFDSYHYTSLKNN